MALGWLRRHRLSVLGAAALVCLAGLVALWRLPVQLLPDIEAPTISVWTAWPGAAAAEIERAITEPQESVMRGLAGLESINANANPGGSWLQMQFAPGTELDAMFVEVVARLQRAPALPRDAQPPQVTRGDDGPERTLIYFFVQLLPGTPGPIESHQALLQRVVIPRLQRVPGVAAARINAGPDTELRVQIDPQRAAALGIELPQLVDNLSRLDDVSAGAVEMGRTNYALRLHGRFDPSALDSLPVGRIGDRVVRLSEIGSASFTRPDRNGFSYQNGNPALAIQLFRAPETNVLDTLDALDAEVALLRTEVLRPAGLAMEKSFEPGIFIRRAVGFLLGNLGIGLFAALACLWVFLRDWRASALIAVAVPVSLLATTLVLAALGRSLNMISIAGLAFAVGMVMDAAIVVVESILARRAAGEAAEQAIADGTGRVTGALTAATLTTVAVFLPVLALKDVEGQVFADLALTVAIAVMASLAVAIWVVPALAPWLLRAPVAANESTAPDASSIWSRLAMRMGALSATRSRALWTSALLVIAPLALAALLSPPRDYLPAVKRAAVDAFLQTPPGMGSERLDAEIAQPIVERLKPHMDGTAEPKLLNYYIIAWNGGATIGARVVDPARIGELETLLNDKVLVGLPDMRAFAAEGELFGGVGGSSRAVWINLSGADLGTLRSAAEAAETALKTLLPGAQVQITPGAGAVSAEIAVIPNDARLAERGLSRAWLADALRVLGDGRFLGEHFDGERRIAMRLRAPAWNDLDTLGETPLATPTGNVSLGELAELSLLRAPSELRRVNFTRAITLTVDPPADRSLEEVVGIIDQQIVPGLREALPAGAGVDVGGSAGRLEGLTRALLGNLGLALGALTLILLLLLRSPFDTAVVLATLPLAALGGVIGLRILGLFVMQPLDLLTMIGFVMLLAMVVSNGVLLVSETRAGQARGLDLDDAIEAALRERLRPLTLGALTGVVGALPLAISPGPAASIYRGLAAVTCGGVLLSLLLVVFLVPALLRLPQLLRRTHAHRIAAPISADPAYQI